VKLRNLPKVRQPVSGWAPSWSSTLTGSHTSVTYQTFHISTCFHCSDLVFCQYLEIWFSPYVVACACRPTIWKLRQRIQSSRQAWVI
jgi:hypothetical protein